MRSTFISRRAFSRTLPRLDVAMESHFSGPRSPNVGNQLNSGGGMPFYGNIYSGRVNTEAYIPPPGPGSGLIGPRARGVADDPAVQKRMQSCPYFALCDMVVWHNMDPNFLDPGILTTEEHQLMLLYSRGFYSKWAEIHSRPDVCFTRVRTRLGTSVLLRELLELVGAAPEVFDVATKEYLLDDASLIGMKRWSTTVEASGGGGGGDLGLLTSSVDAPTPNPTPSSSSTDSVTTSPSGKGRAALWETANLDEAVRDHLSGRILEFIGLTADQQDNFLSVLDQMRRLVVRRRDVRDESSQEGDYFTEAEVGELVVGFEQGVTLHDLCSKSLGISPYRYQIKVFDFIDDQRTSKIITLNDEDSYFDFLVTCFYKANLRLATLGSMADATDTTCRYTVTVVPETTRKLMEGRWI